MLMVTELLQLARGMRSEPAVRRGSPGRFGDRHPPIVVWNVCRQCNQRCPHCYLAAGSVASPDDLDPTEAIRLLQGLAAAGIRVIIFSGGEPLLRPDLLTLVRCARDLGMTCHLSSNGTLLEAGMAASLREAGVSYVGISVDGMSGWNDQYRGMDGGFDLACRGLRNARAAGMRTGLRMTLTRRNSEQLADLHGFARALPVDRFYVSHLVYSGRGRRMATDDLTPADSRAALLRLFELADRLVTEGDPMATVTGANDSDGVLLRLWVQERFGDVAGDAVERLLAARGGNRAGEGILAIDPRGRVHPDPLWRTVVLGDLRRQPLDQVLLHPLLESLRHRETLLGGRCASCPWVTLCRGAHRARAEAITGSWWGEDPACVLTDAERTVPVAEGRNR